MKFPSSFVFAAIVVCAVLSSVNSQQTCPAFYDFNADTKQCSRVVIFPPRKACRDPINGMCYIPRHSCPDGYSLQPGNLCEKKLVITARCAPGFDYAMGECLRIDVHDSFYLEPIPILFFRGRHLCVKGRLSVSKDKCYETVIGPKPILHCDGQPMFGGVCPDKEVIESTLVCKIGTSFDNEPCNTAGSNPESPLRKAPQCPVGYTLDEGKCTGTFLVPATPSQ